ncbi:hypothetical protein [Spiroplasma endosymbiont of Dioctria linearis]|uniref:hypothetical protein n=1 Tax=Spiroplasma endosymbiont of Dioctria linearis TaxID=3066290 RepID=UPI00313AE503
MKKTKYSKELKIEVTKKFNQGHTPKKLVEEYNLTSGVQLVYLWNRKYSNLNYNNTNFCKELNIMANKLKKDFKDKSIKVYEKEIAKLKKQLKESNELVLLSNARYEILEKSIPSCTTEMIINMMKMSKKDLIQITKTKIYKHYSFCIIYKFEALYGMGTNKLINFFYVSKQGYSKFKRRFVLMSPIKIFKERLSLPGFPIFQRKVLKNVNFYIEQYFKTFKGFVSGANIINKWILETYNLNISIREIRKIQRENIFKMPTFQRKKRTNLGINKSNNYIRKDSIMNNFKKENVIEVDGSHMKIRIKGVLENQVVIFGYNWSNNNIISYSFDRTENSNNAFKVFNKIKSYVKNLSISIFLIQTDRGTAFANKMIFSFINRNSNFLTHSMSEAGFKHNAPTESLNGWVKNKFYKQYSNEFTSMEDFHNKFANFVEMWNLNHDFKYNINRKKQFANIANW